MKRKYIVTIFITALLAGGLASAWAVNKGLLGASDKVVVLPEAMVYNREEQEAIDELLLAFEKMARMPAYTFEGHISVIDPADSSANLAINVSYAKSGDSVYCQLGENRSLTMPGLYISVDDVVKKIFVAATETNDNTAPALPFNIPKDTLVQLFRMEGYKVTVTNANGIKTVRLLRENHITCKEYRLSYDEQYHIRQLYTRFTDFNDPLNHLKDKVTNVTISHWQEGSVPPAMLRVDAFVRDNGDSIVPAPSMEGYEVVTD